jgi:hypothetical protein
MAAPPPISPDGAFWWDGESWLPMPPGGLAALLEGLPVDEETPAAVAPTTPPAAARAAPSVSVGPPAAAIHSPHAVDGPAAHPVDELSAWLAAVPTADHPLEAEAEIPVAPTRPPRTDSSWLPADFDFAGIHHAVVEPKNIDTAPPPASVVPPPVWTHSVRRSRLNRIARLLAFAAVALIVVGSGALAVDHYGLPTMTRASVNPSPQPTVSPAASPSSTIVRPFTAQIQGAPCPVAHVGDPACWKGTFTNTGPAITDLVLIVQTDPPYASWFEHHFGAAMAAGDNSAGCSVDTVHLQIDCGPVPEAGHITIHLVGYIANVGAHTYGVRFVNTASGTRYDVNLNPDGGPFILSWTESIT